MAAWDVDAETTHPVDFRLVMNGFATLFHSAEVLAATTDELRDLDYELVEFDASSWTSADDMFAAFAERLDFPNQFGRNLSALNDCLSDVAVGDYGVPEDAAGLVLVLRSFDMFTEADREVAHALVDIVAKQARYAMLFGRRIVCLVQSNNPRISLNAVGATPLSWNDVEFLDSARGI